jgi:septum formation protein
VTARHAAPTRLVLASSSPRRAQILESLGIPFRVSAADVPESILPGETAADASRRLAREKARAVAGDAADAPVLGADTLVFLDDTILGKPDSAEDARRMLRGLAGRTHSVVTGLCLIHDGREEVQSEISEVAFRPMSDDEIAWYVATGESMGKAGAYAVQGRAARFIESIRGSWSNVVGLPARPVYEMLRAAGLENLALPAASV